MCSCYRDVKMSSINKVHDTIHLLSQNSSCYTLKETDYPSFAQFFRQKYIDSPSRNYKISNDDRRVLNKYERSLAFYWISFPKRLISHPLVKDLAFFFTCLFEIKSPKDKKIVLNIWDNISDQESSPYSRLKYYVPGDYRSLLAPRTKSQRLRIAHYLLQMFEKAIILKNDAESIDFERFLKDFHRYVFIAPKVLSSNDICLLRKIISLQSDNRQILESDCQMNKNTVSSRLQWLISNHVLFSRQRVAYDSFGLIPYLLLLSTNNGPLFLRKYDDLNPWIFSELIGSNNQQMHYLLVPNTAEGKTLLDTLVHDTLPSLTSEVHLLQRSFDHDFFLYNINSYDLTSQQWRLKVNSSSSENTEGSIIWPFKNRSVEPFWPTSIQMRIINHFNVYPTATHREVCKELKIGSSTLVQELRTLTRSGVISDLFGFYPFDLPEFFTCMIHLRSENRLNEVLDRILPGIPILQGGFFTGDHQGVFFNIPFPNRSEVVRFHNRLLDENEDIIWFQVNEHPFSGTWFFPLDFWNKSTNSWVINKQTNKRKNFSYL